MNLKATLKVLGGTIYKNRATIETVAGMALVAVGTGVVISKAREATKVADELEIRNAEIHRRDAVEGWSDKRERSKEVKSMLKCAAVGYTKAYWLGLTLEIGGLTLIAISDISMNKELTAANALIATYAATLSKVRERVIEEQGEEKWNEYLYGPQETTTEVLPDGTVVTRTKPLGDIFMPHTIMFDAHNRNHEDDPAVNLGFVEDHLRWLDKRLEYEGYLWENDIRRDMGEEPTKSGWTSGISAWKIDPVTGDKVRNHLSFGLEANTEAAQRFRDGLETDFLIQLGQRMDGEKYARPIEDNILDQLQLALI